MVFVFLFVLTVLAIWAFLVWPILDGTPANPVKEIPPAAAPARPPQSLEGVLTAQLLAGEITRGQYLRSIEGLAARDDERHPLEVPPETGPAGV